MVLIHRKQATRRRVLLKVFAFGAARPYYPYARSEFRFDGLRDPEYSGPTTI